MGPPRISAVVLALAVAAPVANAAEVLSYAKSWRREQDERSESGRILIDGHRYRIERTASHPKAWNVALFDGASELETRLNTELETYFEEKRDPCYLPRIGSEGRRFAGPDGPKSIRFRDLEVESSRVEAGTRLGSPATEHRLRVRLLFLVDLGTERLEEELEVDHKVWTIAKPEWTSPALPDGRLCWADEELQREVESTATRPGGAVVASETTITQGFRGGARTTSRTLFELSEAGTEPLEAERLRRPGHYRHEVPHFVGVDGRKIETRD